MITFYALLIGIVLVPILMMLPALRNKRAIVNINRDGENIHIARQRLREMEKRKDEEGINFQQDERELQATLLEDLHEHGKAAASNISTVTFKSGGLLIILLIPLLSLSLYSYLGEPQFAVMDNAEAVKQTDRQLDINQLLALLETKLAQNPNNAQGWELAANTYMKLGNYQKATSAYEKLNTLVPGSADFMVAWADAEIMLAENIYTPAVKDRIEKALTINPYHINGLWMASLGAESLGDYDKALPYLHTLLALVADNDESTANIERLIARMTIKAGDRQTGNTGNGQQTATDDGKTITIEVILADKLIAQADENDVVFVFAKALKVPSIPLAVSKHHVKELPFEITLTENMAMLPNMTIASFDKITITARVSKSGKPIQQPGDLVSDNALVTKETQDNTIKLIINQIVK